MIDHSAASDLGLHYFLSLSTLVLWVNMEHCSVMALYWLQLQKLYLQTCAPREDLDQPGHSHGLIRLFSRCILGSQGCNFFMQTENTLIRLQGGASWFETSLGAYVWQYIFLHCNKYVSFSSVTAPPPTAIPSGYCKDITWKQFGGSCYYINLRVGLRLTLKAPSKICSRRHSKKKNFLFFRENKSWHFMWIICQDDLHEMSRLIFSLEKKLSSAAVVIGL